MAPASLRQADVKRTVYRNWHAVSLFPGPSLTASADVCTIYVRATDVTAAKADGDVCG